MTFDKSAELFPVRNRYVFLSSCGISPLFSGGLARETELARAQCETGSLIFSRYNETLQSLRSAAARLLKTEPENLSFHRNTSEGISMIAGGYPFRPGDQVITYVHEYPANYYPWRLQERRGVEVVELKNSAPAGCPPCGDRPCAFSFEELERRITERTRIVALSHVQFTSGFALDLAAVGRLCRARGIDLVIDGAQSLGAMPIYPEEHGVAAVVSAGWKWLLGPLSSGLMYTSPTFRARLEQVMIGAEVMQQGIDYLDHSWKPVATAKRFEYSTSSIALAAALEAAVSQVHLRYGIEALRDEIFRLQDLFTEFVDRRQFTPLRFHPAHRSGILAVLCQKRDPQEIAKALLAEGFICTARGGYLRFAPHFYVTDDEVRRFADTLNRSGS